ncbi:hypothetical protein BC829DRAFT_441426 [Chytridium lagenaria]|nr:hypothetical protein BC829DRAFT_441426 [Chytridium lagenaria]
MAPIVLKIKASQNNDNFSPFAEMDTGDDLARAWKVCTKVKDALEHGNRLENLSWRLWHLHQSLVTSKKMTQPEFRKQATRTTRKLNENDITSCHHQHLLQNSPRQSAINHPSPPASTSTPPSSPPASTSLHTDDFPTPRRHLAASLDQSAARRPSMSGLTLFPSNPILLPYHVSSQQPQTVASKRPSPCIFTRNGSTSAPTPPYVSPPLESAMLSGPPSFTSETSEGDDSDTDMMDIKLDTDEPSPTPH